MFKAFELPTKIKGNEINKSRKFFFKGIDHVQWSTPIRTLDKESRGLKIRMERELVKNCNSRYHFLTNRIVNYWNDLPQHVVDCKNLNQLKKLLDETLTVTG